MVNPDRPFLALAELKKKLLAEEAELKKAQSRLPAAPPPPVRESSPAPAAEEELYWREMADVVPLKGPGRRTERPPLGRQDFKWAPAVDEDQEVLRRLQELVSGRGDISDFDLFCTDEYAEGRLRTLPPGVMEELKAGRIPYQAHLDLHGETFQRAKLTVARFVADSVSLRRRCLLLIHGRGRRSAGGVGVLKNHLEDILLRPPIKKYILAFASARPVDGGAGASYILLKE
ncbi:MAG: Smr/MutS family protein [Deltaproteobacteria bacterium]|jgi:DNA-nicking Smr family endonuclease|nr:Smr/MutS family protein [Deltaproteobacteria bacterium]